MPKKKNTVSKNTKSAKHDNKPAKRGKEPTSNRPKKYRSFRLEKKIKHHSSAKISNSYRLLKDSLSFFFQHFSLFGGIILIYLLLSLVLVGINSGTNVSQTEESLVYSLGEDASELDLGVATFTSMVGASAGGTEGGTAFQVILTVMISLASVWVLRQLMAGQKIGIRDAFYKGMYPLVPVLLVIFVIGLQLVPIAIASFLYSVTFVGGLAINAMEQFLWAVLIFLLALLSVYMITSSIFAFYIAALPDMRPIRALRSARELVAHRRWSVMRKVLFLPFALLIIGLIILLPLILVWPVAAQWAFIALSMASVVFAHVYLYSLYKELLQ